MSQHTRPRRIVCLWLALPLAALACSLGGPSQSASNAPPGESTSVQSDAPSEPRATEPRPASGGCQVFPADNVWNVPFDSLPVDAVILEYE